MRRNKKVERRTEDPVGANRRHRCCDQRVRSSPKVYVFFTSGRYQDFIFLVHAILAVRASLQASRRAGGFPGSHGPERPP